MAAATLGDDFTKLVPTEGIDSKQNEGSSESESLTMLVTTISDDSVNAPMLNEESAQVEPMNRNVSDVCDEEPFTIRRPSERLPVSPETDVSEEPLVIKERALSDRATNSPDSHIHDMNCDAPLQMLLVPESRSSSHTSLEAVLFDGHKAAPTQILPSLLGPLQPSSPLRSAAPRMAPIEKPPRSTLKKKRKWAASESIVGAKTNDAISQNNAHPRQSCPTPPPMKRLMIRFPPPSKYYSINHLTVKYSMANDQISVQEINEQFQVLFPKLASKIMVTSSVSARLFACYALHSSRQMTSNCPSSPPRSSLISVASAVGTPMTRRRKRLDLERERGELRKKQQQQQQQKLQTTDDVNAQANRTSQLQELLPLLNSLVELELITLGGLGGCQPGHIGTIPTILNKSSTCNKENGPAISTTFPQSSAPLKKVHFSGFDGSSTKTPVDVLPESHIHQLQCISQMKETLRIAMATIRDTTIKLELGNLVAFLRSLPFQYQRVSAESIKASFQSRNQNLYYPPSRLAKAAESYRHDLQLLFDRMEESDPPFQSPLHIETRLADACARVIRYSLRHLFNPIPGRANFDEEDFTRIADLVLLLSRQNDEQVDDSALASMVSNALRNIFDHLGGSLSSFVQDGKLTGESDAPPRKYYKTFCSSDACHRGTGTPSVVAKYSAADWNEILLSISDAGLQRATFNSLKFLQSLFTSEGVEEELKANDQWNILQSHANMLGECVKSIATPAFDDDAHLAMLKLDRTCFLKRLEELLELTEDNAISAKSAMNAMCRRLKLDGPSKQTKFWRRYRNQLKQVQLAYDDALEIYSFPHVFVASYEDELPT